VQIDYRWGAGNPDTVRKHAAELAALAPDVVLGVGSSVILALQAATRTVPIVFVSAIDPVGLGLVQSLARPGGNATGFMQFEFGISGKWLELLKQIAPSIARVAVLRDRTNPVSLGQLGALQTAAHSRGVELSPVVAGDSGDIERVIASWARGADGGLVVLPSALAIGPCSSRLRVSTDCRLSILTGFMSALAASSPTGPT
jgi:ABC-type uncharacterized transport system substrate-binding protein